MVSRNSKFPRKGKTRKERKDGKDVESGYGEYNLMWYIKDVQIFNLEVALVNENRVGWIGWKGL